MLMLILFVVQYNQVILNCCRVWDSKIHNINAIEFGITNYGIVGNPCFWPKGSEQNYIYGAGLWVGALDTITHDTMVTIGYGPHGGEVEFAPGLYHQTPYAPEAKIYLYPDIWPPPKNIFPMAVQKSFSQQDSWCCYNDCDITYHVAGDSKPIGIEVYQTVYAWDIGLLSSMIFLTFEIKNVLHNPIDDLYIGFCSDCDIGNESGSNANDICYGFRERQYVIGNDTFFIDNLAFQWQNVLEPGWIGHPGVIGFDLLQTPFDLKPGFDKDLDSIFDQHERDSAYYVNNLPVTKWDVDNDKVPDWRDPSEIPQMGMTSYKRFTLNLEPNKDNERYLTLAGYNYKTMEYCPYDTIIPLPDDQRFLLSVGPFNLMPDSTVVIRIGLMITSWDPQNHSMPDTEIVMIDHWLQFFFDMNWLLPGPPPPPKLTCVPGDAKITLVWDNSSETTPDPYYDVVSNPSSPNYDPYYKKYDFEGYRVWKSPTGKTGTWSLLASFDLSNGITFKDPNAPDSIALTATDVGLVHSYVDTDVRNGFGYYYAVTSFDYNYVKDYFDSVFVKDSLWYAPDSKWIYIYDTVKVQGPRPIYFESGLTGVVAVPRRDPVDYQSGSVSGELLSGNPRLIANVGARVVYPLNMKEDPQYLEFGPIVRVGSEPQYTAYLRDKDSVKVDSFSVVMPLDTFAHSYFYEFKEFNGVSVTPWFIKNKIKGSVVIFSAVEKESGTYPDSLIRLDATAAGRAINWAYRGNDFKVIWKKKDPSGEVNTVVVIDMFTGDTIPYRPYLETPATDSLADGWCFRSMNFSSDTLVYSNTASQGTRALYICSGKFGISKTWMRPGHPRPSESDVWIVRADAKYAPAPFGAWFAINSTPARMVQDSTLALNVKVVPNPYLIHNEWQQSSLIRRLRFINLPSECVIRIFTLNGDLVKTIVHKATVGSVLGDAGGDEWWDLLTDNRQLVASGVYVFHVDSKVGQQTGKFVVVR
ncbi:MAG: hypothetical protein ABIL02_02675 [candidate division WOR-3 bacterium]